MNDGHPNQDPETHRTFHNEDNLPFLHCAALVRTVGPLRDEGIGWRFCRLAPQYLLADTWPVCNRHKMNARIDAIRSPYYRDPWRTK